MGFGNLLDGLQSTDERLASVNQKLDRLSEQVSAIASAIEHASGGDVVDVRQDVLRGYTWKMSKTVPADTPKESPAMETRDVPWDARLDGVIVGWPAGTNNLTGVQLRTAQGEILFPRDSDSQYVAMDNFSDRFTLTHSLSEGEQLQAQFINLPNQNGKSTGHYVTCLPQIRERR